MGSICVLSVFILTVAIQATATQRFNGSLYSQAPIVVSSNSGGCPSDSEREGTLSSIRQDVTSHLRNLTRNGTSTYNCGGTGGWMRIVYLNMTNTSQQCPSGWTEATYSGLRLCGRPSNAVSQTCESAYFTVGFEYSEVCGRAVGYQFGDPVAFALSSGRSIDGYYMDGLTLTYGSSGSRMHIWSFVNGLSENRVGQDACPCAPFASTASPPSFVGTNYFCESGTIDLSFTFQNERLWDGEGCFVTGNTCCSFNSPPYFTRQLQAPTSDNLEGRLCGYQSRDSGSAGTLIQLLEIYVK